MSYGPLVLLPQCYQDDLSRCCQDPHSAQEGLDRFESLAESKLLTYNLKKSYIVILGAKKARRELKKKFEKNPPKLYGQPLQIVNHQTYLGDEVGISSSKSISYEILQMVLYVVLSVMSQ